MKYIKRKLLQFLARHLLKAITEDDVLIKDGNRYILKGIELTPEQILELKEEAKSIINSEVWRFTVDRVGYTAFMRGRKATKDEDNLACYWMFYNLEIIQSFLEDLSK